MSKINKLNQLSKKAAFINKNNSSDRPLESSEEEKSSNSKNISDPDFDSRSGNTWKKRQLKTMKTPK
jgi:hypothetical protein